MHAAAKTPQRRPTRRPELEALAPAAPLHDVLTGLSLPADTPLNVYSPDAVARAGALFATEPLDSWKAYLRYQLLAHYGPYLSKPFEEEVFKFYSGELQGVQQ